jgi:hypothetical protein
MKKTYIQTTFGKLENGDRFWTWFDDSGLTVVEKIKQNGGFTWADEYNDVETYPIDINFPVWIAEPSIWREYPRLILLAALAILTIGSTWYLVREFMAKGWWK